MKQPHLLILIMVNILLVACEPPSDNSSDKPIRLQVSPDQLLWDGKELSFHEPLSQWVAVIGDDYIDGKIWKDIGPVDDMRLVYPELAIDIQVIFNPKGDPGPIDDVMQRYVKIVRIYLNSDMTIVPYLVSSSEKQHPYFNMSVPFAINLYGAIVDSDTPKADIIKYAEPVSHHPNFNGVYTSRIRHKFDINAYINFNNFFGNKPEKSHILQITPSEKIEKENIDKYFGNQQHSTNKPALPEPTSQASQKDKPANDSSLGDFVNRLNHLLSGN